MNYSSAQLTLILKEANVKGRSSAKTLSEKLELCKVHDLLNKTIPELPNDILHHIVQLTVDNFINYIKTNNGSIAKVQEFYLTLVALSSTCKDLNTSMPNSHECWVAILRALANSHDVRDSIQALNYVEKGKVSARRALQLVTGTGCEFCKCARTRTVQWPFLKRWCQRCLESNTLSDYRLTHDYYIKPSILNDIPYLNVNLYSRYYGPYVLAFYQIDQVIEAYAKKTSTNVTCLEDILRIGLAEEKLRKAKEYEELMKRHQEAYALQKEKEAAVHAMFLNVSNDGIPYSKSKLVTHSKLYYRMIWGDQTPDQIRILFDYDPNVIENIKKEVVEYDLRNLIKRCVKDSKKDIGDGHETIPSEDIFTYCLQKSHDLTTPMPTRFTKKWFREKLWSDDTLSHFQSRAAANLAYEEEKLRKKEEKRQRREEKLAPKYLCPHCTHSEKAMKREFLQAGLIQHMRDYHKINMDPTS